MKTLKHSFRLYVLPNELDNTVRFYEELQQSKCERRLSFPDTGIEVAVVGNFIILAGTTDVLAPHKHVLATLAVDSLDEAYSWLKKNGATMLSEPHNTPVGKNLFVRNPDGLVVEYFEPARAATGSAADSD